MTADPGPRRSLVIQVLLWAIAFACAPWVSASATVVDGSARCPVCVHDRNSAAVTAYDLARAARSTTTGLPLPEALHAGGKAPGAVAGLPDSYDLPRHGIHTYYVIPQSADGRSGSAVLVHNANKPCPTMLGANGTKTTSTTLTKPGHPYRIDVENPNPGVRPGQLHLQDSNGGKYLYNFETNTFDGIPSGLGKKVAADPEAKKAIKKGRAYLGLE